MGYKECIKCGKAVTVYDHNQNIIYYEFCTECKKDIMEKPVQKDRTEFEECPECKAKPGSPVLCTDCLERRSEWGQAVWRGTGFPIEHLPKHIKVHPSTLDNAFVRAARRLQKDVAYMFRVPEKYLGKQDVTSTDKNKGIDTHIEKLTLEQQTVRRDVMYPEEVRTVNFKKVLCKFGIDHIYE